ncbi:hypothetical protein ACJJTC_009672 [Scirpophaga incertulas]
MDLWIVQMRGIRNSVTMRLCLCYGEYAHPDVNRCILLSEGAVSAPALQDILKKIVTQVGNTGLMPLGLVCDQGTTFKTAIKKEKIRRVFEMFTVFMMLIIRQNAHSVHSTRTAPRTMPRYPDVATHSLGSSALYNLTNWHFDRSARPIIRHPPPTPSWPEGQGGVKH